MIPKINFGNRLLVLFSLFVFLGCQSSQEDERAWPIKLQQDDAQLDTIFNSGKISYAYGKPKQGKKLHSYTLYLTKEATKNKYDEIGYYDGNAGYYQIEVSDPAKFEALLQKYGVRNAANTSAHGQKPYD